MQNVIRYLNNKQFALALACAEQTIYMLALKDANGNQSKAARLLGVSRTTLISKIKRDYND